MKPSLSSRTAWSALVFVVPLALSALIFRPGRVESKEAKSVVAKNVDRSPCDIVLANDESFMVAANETAGTISLIDLSSRRGKVLDEQPCGQRPKSVVLLPDQKTLFVTSSYAGTVSKFRIQGAKLKRVAVKKLGFEPVGIAIAKDGKSIFVSLMTASVVVELTVADLAEKHRIKVGRWPRYLAVSPDGNTLAVGCSGDRNIAVVDLAKRQLRFLEPTSGINQGRMIITADNRYVYQPYMVYRQNPINVGNLRKGWILASRVTRVRLDESVRREAISLDVPRRAVADPHGIALVGAGDDRHLVVSAAGTHELLVYRFRDIPVTIAPGDLIDPRLTRDRRRFYRIPVGGRPMSVRASRRQPDVVYVANYLSNEVQRVNIRTKKVEPVVHLGGPKRPSLARRGEAIFLDGQRSMDQWYSCHSCHYEGGSNAVAMDTHNDGSTLTMKTVLPLFNVVQTSPWTWHGWQTDLRAAMNKSLTSTMLGKRGSEEDVDALLAYLKTLRLPPNPYHGKTLGQEAKAGKKIFHSAQAGCANCHTGKFFSDGDVHDVGLEEPRDRYKGFNTPSLLGVHRKVRYLHDGSVRTLDEVLSEDHSPQKVSNSKPLTDQQRRQLIAYLRTL